MDGVLQMNSNARPEKINLGNVSVTIPNTLLKRLEVDSGWLVLIQPERLVGEDAGRNVRLYDRQGILLWRIQAAPEIPRMPTPPWYSFYFSDAHQKWVVATSHGWDYFVDLSNGVTTAFQRSH